VDKKLQLTVWLLVFLALNLAGCSTNPPVIKTAVGGVQKFDQTVVVNYDVSDSIAHSLIKIWISENMNDGVRGINVDDAMNGIIAGRSQVTRNLYPVEYYEDITYRIYITNGIATLHLVSIWVYGKFIAEDLENANTAAENILDRLSDKLKNSFLRIF